MVSKVGILFIVGIIILVGVVAFWLGGSTTGGSVIEQKKSAQTSNLVSVSKSPFGFKVWNTLNIKEVSFEVVKKGYTSMSATSCLDYLREHYESPMAWKDFDYQCVLDSVNSNMEELTKQDNVAWTDFTLIGTCRCEYLKK